MRISALLVASLGLASTGSAALAQTATETVDLSITVSQPSLFNDSARDTFAGTIDDRLATTTLSVVCSAGASAWLGLSRIDEACSVTGTGLIKNPANPAQTLPRINYSGGFTIEAAADGYTNAATILANYLRAGAAGAENSSFRGNLVMMPENPSESARALGQRLMENLRETTTGTSAVQFDTTIDAIRFENFTVPQSGHQGGVPCSWTGDAIFAYANDSWQMQFDVTCGDQSYRLEGNMPLIEAATGSSHQEEYVLNLVLPGAGGGDPFGAPDPFATIDGITSTLTMTNAGRSNSDGVYQDVAIRGQLVGTGLPLELVRGWGQIMVIFGRTFFGA